MATRVVAKIVPYQITHLGVWGYVAGRMYEGFSENLWRVINPSTTVDLGLESWGYLKYPRFLPGWPLGSTTCNKLWPWITKYSWTQWENLGPWKTRELHPKSALNKFPLAYNINYSARMLRGQAITSMLVKKVTGMFTTEQMSHGMSVDR